MKKMSGWQKAGLVAGVGCLSIIGIVVIGVAIAFVRARSLVADLGDPTPARVERSIPFDQPATQDGGASPGAAQTGTGPARLELNLQEASFDIRPGPPGRQVQVEGTYADGYYELTETHDTGPRGEARTTVSFRAKAPAWARMLSGLGQGGPAPRMTVLVPLGEPIDLSLHVSLGNSRIELGGLTLSDLDLDLSMGNHDIDFGEPLSQDLKRLSLNARMGNVSVAHLGNARAGSVETSGNMGNLTADLAGAWQPGAGADVSFNHSMGELTLNVPAGVKVEPDFNAAQGQIESRPAGVEQTTDAAAPVLRLRVRTSMGNGHVIRY